MNAIRKAARPQTYRNADTLVRAVVPGRNSADRSVRVTAIHSNTRRWFAALILVVAVAQNLNAGETLYNGIVLPDVWPPRLADFPENPVTPPYLASPPKLIPIDVGRQLFVDDFLIESTTLKRAFHAPEYYAGNPIVKPDQPWESAGRGPAVMPFSDGVWFDPKDKLFKMWYYAGHGGGQTCYATSKDGIRWEKPKLDVVPDTNIVLKGGRDSNTIWLDHNAKEPEQRFKMAVYAGGGMFSLFRSADGIHWAKAGDGSKTGDRSSFFYNPFRERWVFSIRSSSKRGRSRHYWETTDFFSFTPQVSEKKEPVVWIASDNADWKRDDLLTQPQLYNLDCAAYESVLVGLFSVWRGDYRGAKQTPKAVELNQLGRPKQNSICVGFSRDGFHWDRTNRQPFCPVSEKMGDWNWGNVQSVGGCCLVMGDKLYFYVSGRAGKSFPGCNYNDAGASTGLAILRRDGFVSMDAGDETATLTTRPVQFRGKHLFVNLAAPKGELRVEALDRDGRSIKPFTRDNCVLLRGDKTFQAVKWKGA
ncbi:MAG: glycoside hydrolase family 32 protein, partial [Verrucomicrobia bacterium]|nr:glycoside hydrolase family 32 protein [Verrucomicrobiota bacterium]